MATRRILFHMNLLLKTLLRSFCHYYMRILVCYLQKGILHERLLQMELNKAGASCDEVIVYETVLPKESVPKLSSRLASARSGCDYVYKFVNHSSLYANCGTISVAPTSRKPYHCMYRTYYEKNSAYNIN